MSLQRSCAIGSGLGEVLEREKGEPLFLGASTSPPLMNVGVVGLQEPRIPVTLYTSETYLLSATHTPTQRSDRSYVRNAPPI